MKFNSHRIQLLFCLFSAALLVAANIFIFNTFDVFRENPSEFELGYLSMLHLLLTWGGLFLLVAMLPGIILPTGILTRYASFWLILGVLTWIQSGMLIWDYGVFDGRDTAWNQYDALGWMDLGLWVGLIAIALYYAQRVVTYSNVVAWILIVGQALLLLGQGSLDQKDWNREYVPTNNIPAGILEVSRQQNIVHIILDSMQTDVFLELVETLDLSDEFSGFTLFYENVSAAPQTSLALPAIFSGELFDGSQSPSTYYKSAMRNGFQNRLYEAGFTVNLIPQLSMRDSNYSNYYEIPSVYEGTAEDLRLQSAAQLLDIGLFRGSPHFARKALYDEGNWFLLTVARGGIQSRSFQEKAFFRDYIQRLSRGSDLPAYHFIHLMPPHPPYVTLANGGYAGRSLPNTRENYLNESRAIVKMVGDFMEKLKSIGAYDNSMIILQGDHGSQIDPVVNGNEIQTCVSRIPALLAVKQPDHDEPFSISHAPTSLLDVSPTIMKVLGGTGQSVFEMDESMPRQRQFIVLDNSDEAAKVISYSISGSVFDPTSCQLRGSLEVISGVSHYSLGTELLFGMTGNADTFMRSGWSACHAKHCWSAGNQADINLPTGPVDSDLLLHVRFKPFLDEEKLPQQRILVSVNGRQLTQWVVTRNEFQTANVRIPAEITREESLRIKFNFPDAASPKALDLGGDRRLLGFAINALRIDAVEDGSARD